MRKITETVGKTILKSATTALIPSGPPESEEEPQADDTDTNTIRKQPKADTDTETSDANRDDEGSDSDEDPAARAKLHYGAADKNFGATTFVDADKRTTWNVLLRVIEGRDLMTGALRVRASLDGLQKCTRVSSQGNPVWKQNLIFMLKDISLQKLATDTLTIKVTRAKRFSEKVTGEFACPVGSVVHSPGRVVISKWIALRAPADEEDDEGVYENCGFLKVSINVYSIMDCPARMNDDLDSEEIWCGAQLEEMSLSVTFGAESVESTSEELEMYKMDDDSTEAIIFDQELILPMLWPTVISKIFGTTPGVGAVRGVRRRIYPTDIHRSQLSGSFKDF
ncbi:hypothetical protein KIN20_031306 [Parelaphostrongylus tenuis]|uniref:C2 domain-containing protein n=1 Tax=Parelaphostrongylus tenuis TaxID=148309 RepID=A0AAD5WH61_PARTN|nr:hypothetical protein KIN20_031306 [Parelaphostrongylus tenuis]